MKNLNFIGKRIMCCICYFCYGKELYICTYRGTLSPSLNFSLPSFDKFSDGVVSGAF